MTAAGGGDGESTGTETERRSGEEKSREVEADETVMFNSGVTAASVGEIGLFGFVVGEVPSASSCIAGMHSAVASAVFVSAGPFGRCSRICVGTILRGGDFTFDGLPFTRGSRRTTVAELEFAL